MWNLYVEMETLRDAGELINGISKIKGVEYHLENKISCEIALSGDNEYSKELALETIAEYIVKKYKSDYLFSAISLNYLPPEQKNALIKALVLFDIESDIYFTLLAIEKLSRIVMKSVDIFMLGKIKNKWAEFSTVANLNGGYLLNYDVFVEFMKFLIGSIQPKTQVVNLKCDVNNYMLFDNNNSLLTSCVDLSDDIGLITNLVILAPQNINIHCIDQVSSKTFKTLYYLFDKRINLFV